MSWFKSTTVVRPASPSCSTDSITPTNVTKSFIVFLSSNIKKLSNKSNIEYLLRYDDKITRLLYSVKITI